MVLYFNCDLYASRMINICFVDLWNNMKKRDDNENWKAKKQWLCGEIQMNMNRFINFHKRKILLK